jgi:hypothetical protein
VDDGGGINVLYYDDRNTTIDSATVYLSRSTDGGTSWADFRIADHNYFPQPINGLGQGYQGDNIGITSTGDTLWTFWMDNSTGIYQIWCSVVRISSLVGVDTEELPAGFTLHQNHPNPFNPGTTITYQVAGRDAVSLRVYDLLGREVATLVNGVQSPGRHSVRLEAGHLPSGVYIYRLQTKGMVQQRKMLLMK